MFNNLFELFDIAGFKLTKLQKILLIMLCVEVAVVGEFMLIKMIGTTFMGVPITNATCVMEAMQSAFTLPLVILGIMKVREP